MKPLEEQNPWEILGVHPGASEDDVRRAYERLSAALAPGSLALYSLAELAEQRALEQQLRAAYLTLMRAFGWGVPTVPDPERPAAEAAPEPWPADVAAAVPAEEPAAKEAALPPGTEFTGGVLRRVRESMGLTVSEVAERTRIRPRQIESIEEEAFESLPERVFVRGFVMAYARELRLDPEQVWGSYGKRWEAVKGRE